MQAQTQVDQRSVINVFLKILGIYQLLQALQIFFRLLVKYYSYLQYSEVDKIANQTSFLNVLSGGMDDQRMMSVISQEIVVLITITFLGLCLLYKTDLIISKLILSKSATISQTNIIEIAFVIIGGLQVISSFKILASYFTFLGFFNSAPSGLILMEVVIGMAAGLFLIFRSKYLSNKMVSIIPKSWWG